MSDGTQIDRVAVADAVQRIRHHADDFLNSMMNATTADSAAAFGPDPISAVLGAAYRGFCETAKNKAANQRRSVLAKCVILDGYLHSLGAADAYAESALGAIYADLTRPQGWGPQ